MGRNPLTGNYGERMKKLFAALIVIGVLTVSELLAGPPVAPSPWQLNGTTVELSNSAWSVSLTGELTIDENGIEGQPTDTITDCSSFAATGGGLFYDDSEGKWKKCQDNVLSDLDTNTGGATAYDDISDPDASGSIGFGAYTGTYTSATDGWGGIIISNTTADNASDTTLLSLSFNDALNDANSIFFSMRADVDGTPVSVLKGTTQGLYLGAGTPTQTMTGDDLFVSGFLEVDGSIYADGGIVSASSTDPYMTFDVTDPDDTDWTVGTNADAGASSDDDLEFRTSATPGSGVVAHLEPDTGIFAVTGGFDVIGAVDMDYGSADTTDHTFTTDGTGDGEIVLPANSIGSSEIDTIVQSIVWDSSGFVADGTQCANPSKVTINSGPAQYTVICADNDASTIYGHVIMPDSWDGGTVTFELEYLQTAADTNALNADVCMQCRGAGETVNSTWGTEVAIDDAGVTGSNVVDHTTSGAVTPNGTCAAGDTLYWRVQLDATGTTTAVATLHFLGAKIEYTSNVGD